MKKTYISYRPVLLFLVLAAGAGMGTLAYRVTHLPKAIAGTTTPQPRYAIATPLVQQPVATATVLPTAQPAAASSKVVSHILMYHYIRDGVDPKKDPIGYGLSVTPQQFEAQLAALSAAGYTGLTMSQYSAGQATAKSVMLTFDDGYEDFYTTAWPLLKKYHFTATAYIISGKIGGNYMTWDQLRELHAAGIEIGAHTVNHIDLSKASEAVQHSEIFNSKQTIEAQVGAPVVSFCYPSGKYTATTEALVKQAGYTSATTTHPGSVRPSDDPDALNRVRINPDLTPTGLLNLIK